jgi:hypothetical protein
MIDIWSDAYIAAANEELQHSKCPLCEEVGTGKVDRRYKAVQGSLAGTQDRFPVQVWLHYECSACGQEGRLHQ